MAKQSVHMPRSRNITQASDWVSNIDIMHSEQYAVFQKTMTPCHGNAFCIAGPLWGESIGYRWIPLTKGQYCRALVSCLLLSRTSCWNPKKTVELSGIWETTSFMWSQCNAMLLLKHTDVITYTSLPTSRANYVISATNTQNLCINREWVHGLRWHHS